MPVLDRTFDAVTQNWSDATIGQRTDTIFVTITAQFEPSGIPATGADVLLTIEPVNGSGGHSKPHTPSDRPPGRWFGLSATDSLFQKLPFNHRTALQLTTGTDGAAQAYYRSSGLGGLEGLRAVVTSGALIGEAAGTVAVRWQGPLVQVPRNGTHYFFEGSANSHYPGENYLAPGVLDVMEAIWAEYTSLHQADSGRFPLDPGGFKVDAASLPWGGLYDVNRTWRTPSHRLHRTGRDVDFNNTAAEGASLEMADVCRAFSHEGVVTECQLHGPDLHYHALIGDRLTTSSRSPR